MIPVPDGFFYYTLSTIVAGALIWVFIRYINKLDKTLDALMKADHAHNVALAEIKKDIETLKNRRR